LRIETVTDSVVPLELLAPAWLAVAVLLLPGLGLAAVPPLIVAIVLVVGVPLLALVLFLAVAAVADFADGLASLVGRRRVARRHHSLAGGAGRNGPVLELVHDEVGLGLFPRRAGPAKKLSPQGTEHVSVS